MCRWRGGKGREEGEEERGEEEQSEEMKNNWNRDDGWRGQVEGQE